MVTKLENETVKKSGLPVSSLKFIAMGAMVLDHIGLVLIENGYLASFKDTDVVLSSLPLFWVNFIIRIIGKMAFPIYAFLIVEGYRHTKDIRKYLARLLSFAMLSEVPFDLAYRSVLFGFNSQNVLFTLSLGLVSIMMWNAILPKTEDGKPDFFGAKESKKFWAILSVMIFFVIGSLIRVDYMGFGVVIVFFMYLLREDEVMRNVVTGVIMALGGPIDIGGMLAFFPLHYYNGEKGRNLKWLFYSFYPLHLLLLVLIKYLIFM